MTARRPSLMAEGFAPVRDRLVTTLFLAALLHGIVIAGISFSLDEDSSASQGLRVLLVSDEAPEVAHNDSAAYLAQRTQEGSGTTRKNAMPSELSPPLAPEPPSRGSDGDPAAGDAEHSIAAPYGALATIARQPTVRYVANGRNGDEDATPRPGMKQQRPTRTPTPPAPADPPELTGRASEELLIAPDTRAADLAPYVDAWRRKVERLGTLNFPAVARRTAHTRNPVLEVAIAADGRLREARIRRSSGSPQLDQAALDILRIASPFDAFPRPLAARTKVLRLAYEWQFEGAVGLVSAE